MATVDLFKALSDPSRLDIVERLTVHPATVTELAEQYSMSMSGVLQHVRILERSGLVHSRKSGRIRSCWVDADALDEMELWARRHRHQLNNRLDNLEAFLAAPGPDTRQAGGDDDA